MTTILSGEEQAPIHKVFPLIYILGAHLTETQIEMDEDPRKFWFDEVAAAKFVLLPKFALDILAIPASSAPVERVFSVAGLASGGKRNSLKGAHLEQRVMWRKHRDV